MGVPYRVDTGTLVYDTQEVRDVLAVLRAVDDATDEIALVTALRSPLYGCSDADLFTYHHAGGRWSLRAGTPDGVDPHHPVVQALDHLRSLWEERWWLEPSDLTARLLRERQAFALGLANRIVPRESLLAEAFRLADAVAQNAPLAVRETRRGVRELLGLPLDAAYPRQEELGRPLRRTEDAREGQRAFVEKRRPRFVGR